MVATSNDYVAYIDTGTYYAVDSITGNTLSNASFSSLLNALNTAIGSAGGSLYVRPGTYAVDTATTFISNPINFTGGGRGRTILQRTDATHGLPMLAFTAANTTVSHITFDGNYPANTSAGGASEVQFNAANMLVQDCEFKNWKGAGGANNHNILTIRDSIFTGANAANASSYGILSYTDSISTNVQNCNIQYCDLNAIFSYGRTIIRDTYMANNGRPSGGQVGMLAGGTFCGVYNCIFGPGLGGDSGVEAANADFEVIGNRIVGQSGAGITTSPAEPLGPSIFANNIIKNCTLGGIVMQNTALKYLTIRNNICFDDQATPTQRYGIHIGHVGTPYTTTPADYYIIENNICYGNTLGPWLDMGTGTHKIVRNNITL